MASKHRVLKLVANKLAKEATDDELQELDDLLYSDPEMREHVDHLLSWWQNVPDTRQEDGAESFEKVRRRIEGTQK